MTNTDLLEIAAILIKEMFVDYRKIMLKWKNITGQTSQLDAGYIAQHLISLLADKKGSGFRGKGIDLEDGSEIKSACSIDGIDVPRWNHSFRKMEKVEEWLTCPYIYYVLFDTETRDSSRARVRVWRVSPKTDEGYQTVLRKWATSSRTSDNFQLHPPVGKDSNLATNNCGNLDLPLMFRADELEHGEVTVSFFQDKLLPCILYERNKKQQK